MGSGAARLKAVPHKANNNAMHHVRRMELPLGAGLSKPESSAAQNRRAEPPRNIDRALPNHR
jgi:hypothetical protein